MGAFAHEGGRRTQGCNHKGRLGGQRGGRQVGNAWNTNARDTEAPRGRGCKAGCLGGRTATDDAQ
eukprot:1511344-Heterocapsa_arctica.AAC.1